MEIINETMNIFILHSYISLNLCSLLCHIKFQLSFDKPFHDKPSQFCSEFVLLLRLTYKSITKVTLVRYVNI